MSIQIDTARLERIRALKRGSHRSFDHGACVMEAVSYVAGEKFSDRPKCVCPVLGAFMRAWNDGLPTDNDRTRLLRPLIPRLVNTRGSKNLERKRAALAADWLIRVHAPAWLRLAGLDKQADVLASLPEITDIAQCPSLMPTLAAVRDDAAAVGDASLNAARNAASDAAWDAAWATASDAAMYAARNAASDAAWDAAWATASRAGGLAAMYAAWDAARDAVMNAVWDAAKDAALNAARGATWDAALNAAMDVLKPAQEELERSALDLVERMIAATD